MGRRPKKRTPESQRANTTVARLACRDLPPRDHAEKLRLRAEGAEGKVRDTLLAEVDRLCNKAANQERFTNTVAVRQKVTATVSSSGLTDEELNELRMVIEEHCDAFPGIKQWFRRWDQQKIPNRTAYYQQLAHVIQFKNLADHLPSDSLRNRLKALPDINKTLV